MLGSPGKDCCFIPTILSCEYIYTIDATKEVLDYELSRYGCYLKVQNGDSRKMAHSTMPNRLSNIRQGQTVAKIR